MYKYDVLFYEYGQLVGQTQTTANRLQGARKKVQELKRLFCADKGFFVGRISCSVKRCYEDSPVEPIGGMPC